MFLYFEITSLLISKEALLFEAVLTELAGSDTLSATVPSGVVCSSWPFSRTSDVATTLWNMVDGWDLLSNYINRLGVW